MHRPHLFSALMIFWNVLVLIKFACLLQFFVLKFELSDWWWLNNLTWWKDSKPLMMWFTHSPAIFLKEHFAIEIIWKEGRGLGGNFRKSRMYIKTFFFWSCFVLFCFVLFCFNCFCWFLSSLWGLLPKLKVHLLIFQKSVSFVESSLHPQRCKFKFYTLPSYEGGTHICFCKKQVVTKVSRTFSKPVSIPLICQNAFKWGFQLELFLSRCNSISIVLKTSTGLWQSVPFMLDL